MHTVPIVINSFNHITNYTAFVLHLIAGMVLDIYSWKGARQLSSDADSLGACGSDMSINKLAANIYIKYHLHDLPMPQVISRSESLASPSDCVLEERQKEEEILLIKVMMLFCYWCKWKNEHIVSMQKMVVQDSRL